MSDWNSDVPIQEVIDEIMGRERWVETITWKYILKTKLRNFFGPLQWKLIEEGPRFKRYQNRFQRNRFKYVGW